MGVTARPIPFPLLLFKACISANLSSMASTSDTCKANGIVLEWSFQGHGAFFLACISSGSGLAGILDARSSWAGECWPRHSSLSCKVPVDHCLLATGFSILINLDPVSGGRHRHALGTCQLRVVRFRV